jgi:hypothetical protein
MEVAPYRCRFGDDQRLCSPNLADERRSRSLYCRGELKAIWWTIRRRNCTSENCVHPGRWIKPPCQISVVGSSPVFLSREGVLWLGRSELARWFSSLFCPLRGKAWSDGCGHGVQFVGGGVVHSSSDGLTDDAGLGRSASRRHRFWVPFQVAMLQMAICPLTSSA